MSWGTAFAYLSTEEGVLVSTPETAAVETQTKTSAGSEESSDEVDIEKEGKAIVDEIDGKAMLTKSGSPEETKIKVGDLISAGDSVYTDKGASLTISFDNEKLNTVKIPAESKAVFASLNPVEIKLENGSIFNSVDGLAEGSTWKVSTPAAIAAVRGTQFEVEYSETSGEFSTATFEDTNVAKASAVEIQAPSGGPPVQIKEGREMAFKRGQPFSLQAVKTISPERAQRGQKMMHAEVARRKEFVERKKERDLKKGADGPHGPGGSSGGDGHKLEQGVGANRLNRENINKGELRPRELSDGRNYQSSDLDSQSDPKIDQKLENKNDPARSKIHGQNQNLTSEQKNLMQEKRARDEQTPPSLFDRAGSGQSGAPAIRNGDFARDSRSPQNMQPRIGEMRPGFNQGADQRAKPMAHPRNNAVSNNSAAIKAPHPTGPAQSAPAQKQPNRPARPAKK